MPILNALVRAEAKRGLRVTHDMDLRCFVLWHIDHPDKKVRITEEFMEDNSPAVVRATLNLESHYLVSRALTLLAIKAMAAAIREDMLRESFRTAIERLCPVHDTPESP